MHSPGHDMLIGIIIMIHILSIAITVITDKFRRTEQSVFPPFLFYLTMVVYYLLFTPITGCGLLK
jgi:glycerol uptake facilitator-like aquaporin